MRFVKGHGTENDFVVLPPGELDRLDPDVVRRLCDRRTGVGADGVLRVVETGDAEAPWFMDYRNADGSLAEMCGNGIRVFARYLVAAGLAQAGTIRIATRGGTRSVDCPETGDVTVDMGTAQRLPDAKVVLGGERFDARGWSMGNPHLVVLDGPPLDAVDLAAPPSIEPASAYPDGVNVEIVVRHGERHIALRVHERGSGETRSCGTGACAAAVAAMDVAGERSSYAVDVPGGRLAVTWEPGGQVLLHGPAVLTFSGDSGVG